MGNYLSERVNVMGRSDKKPKVLLCLASSKRIHTEERIETYSILCFVTHRAFGECMCTNHLPVWVYGTKVVLQYFSPEGLSQKFPQACFFNA